VTRIGVDIDSTLHHYWDVLERIALERFGVALPYEHQVDWLVKELEREQLVECVRETHSHENILGAVPYPGAVETMRAWHEAGHWIHITSHRDISCHDVTARWLEQVGIPYDDLHCSFDKVTRCVELGVTLLVDDSPVNIVRAREEGITAATLIHPWNAHLIGEDGVVGAEDWAGLSKLIDPLLESSESR
jgi:uncharacterized HAD superfamily protein